MRPLPRKALLGASMPVAIILLWHVASVHSVVVPSIWSVLDVLAHPFRELTDLDSRPFAYGVGISMLRVVCGFSLAALTGVPIGLLIGCSRTAREALSPTTAAAMAVSPIAWIPVTILLFGLSSPATLIYGRQHWEHDLLDQLRVATVAVIWMAAYFPIAVNAAAGARAVRASHQEAAKVLHATRGQLLTKIILPSAAPSIMTGLRVGGGIAWRVVIAAELFPGTRGGLGYMIVTAHETGNFRYAFASILAIGAIGLCLDGLLRLAAARVGRWQRQER